MNELFSRQAAVLRQSTKDYRDGRMGLNVLIQRIEGIGEILENDAWTDATFPILSSMEQLNANLINFRINPSATDKIHIENSLLELEAVINEFETE